MKQHARKAFNALKKIGAPVIDHGPGGGGWGEHFILSAELRDRDDAYFADYYTENLKEYVDGNGKLQNPFGIRTDVNDILRANNLYAEWIDPGTVGIYDS